MSNVASVPPMGSRAELEAMRLMALHERCVGAGLATATIEDAMDSDTPKQALIGLLLDQRPASDKLVAALAEGDAQEREAAYLSIEHTVRAETSLSARDRGGSGGGEKSQAVALAVTCVQPIIEKVLCSPATAEEEHYELGPKSRRRREIADIAVACTVPLCGVLTRPVAEVGVEEYS